MNVNDYKIDFENAITSNIYTDKIFDIKKPYQIGRVFI